MTQTKLFTEKPNAMKKLGILLLLLLVSSIGFAQTTVNLADQCNCEVLSGTAVNAPGATTPGGADTGDIYVNTNTGTIYFWDGNSWELTSTDTNTTNVAFAVVGPNLVLTDSDGNSLSVPLSDIATDTNTTNVSLSENGTSLILTDSDGGTVSILLADLAAVIDTNTTNANFAVVGTDLVITDSDGNTVSVPLADVAAVVDTDDQTAAEVPYDNTVSGLAAADVQAALDEINAAAGNVSLTDNGDGTYDFTDAAGNTTTISDTSISTLVDSGGGSYTYTDEAGNVQTIFTEASTNPYDNSGSGLAANNVQDAIDEINAAAGNVSLTDNGDGTYTFSDAAGAITTISDTSLSTLVDNGDGTLTYTDEAGTVTTFDAKIATVVDNADGTYTITDDFGTAVTIDTNNTVTTLVDNGDGSFTYTSEDGTITTFTETLSTLTDNADGTFTYTDEDGTGTSFTGTDDQTAAEVSVADAGGNFASSDVEGALAELAGQTDDDVSVTNTIAGNRIATISEPGIAAVDIDETITTLSTADAITYTYTSEDGTITNFDGTDDQEGTEVMLTTPIDVDGDTVNETTVEEAIADLAAASTDDQYDDEVPLRTPIDVDEGGEASPTAETTVEEVIQAIAPITSKAARIFYPPSIAIDASTNGTGYTVDLYAQYTAQYGTPAVASAGAPAAVPTYGATELYYYVTYADPTVFDNMSIDANGVLTYDIVGQPADYNSLINVVFVVK